MFTCLRAWRQHAASEAILQPQGESDWSETDRSKALVNTDLIEADAGHRALERLRIEPWDNKIYITAL